MNAPAPTFNWRTLSVHLLLRWLFAHLPSIILSLVLSTVNSIAYARITRIVITSVESPTFEGRVFGSTGAYEKLIGVAYGEVDPALPENAGITDIRLAPRNARGMVEYATDIYILKPVDPRKGNHKLFFEVNNRGNKAFGGFNNSSGGNDPSTASEAGGGFLMNQGFTLAWCGWDCSVTPGNHRLTIRVPVAKHPDGSSIEGPSYEYIVFDEDGAKSYQLAYAAAGSDKQQAKLTVRTLLDGEPSIIPASGWEYTNDSTIRLLPTGTPFQKSFIYEFTYTAKDPVVAGLGFAATRDVISFLRYAKQDDSGTANPVGSDIKYVYSFAVSQPGRYLNDFQNLGFNADEEGRNVIDGMENWLAGGSGIGINFRFAQPSRTERNRQNHLYPEAIFPFAYNEMSDLPGNPKRGRLTSCSRTNTCPKILQVNSANEYWVKAASLLHTDLEGNDIPDPENVRFYLVSGAQHGTGNAASRGSCQQLQNPTSAEPLLRALFVALDDWVTKHVAPPESSVPRRSDGTAALAVAHAGFQTGTVPAKSLGWPPIPGVTYTGIITTRYSPDFGDSMNQGVLTRFPPLLNGRRIFPIFVSKVDRDGNELAGIRLPPVSVPTATTTGWALRRAGFGENDGCEGSGQYIPFAVTKAGRLAAGDPRLSLEERYHSHAAYVQAVTRAAKKLATQRLLLKDDVDAYVREAEERGGLK